MTAINFFLLASNHSAPVLFNFRGDDYQGAGKILWLKNLRQQDQRAKDTICWCLQGSNTERHKGWRLDGSVATLLSSQGDGGITLLQR